LVKLYDLPSSVQNEHDLKEVGIELRRALPIDRHIVVRYVRDTFLEIWASECEASFSHQPPSCFIAVHEKKLVGFGCYNATCWGFFGPLGVTKSFQRKGVGTALVQKCLLAMWNEGYAYAVIGWVDDNSVAFYEAAAGAVVITDSHPGIYGRMIQT